MPASTALGFPYPVPGDAPDGPGAVQPLAAAVDAYLAARAQAYMLLRGTTINVPDSTATPLVSYPGGTLYSAGGISFSGGILTVTVAGMYRWGLTVDWQGATANDTRSAYIYLNGSEVSGTGRDSQSYFGSVGAVSIASSAVVVLDAGDTVQAVLKQTSGVTVTPTPQTFSLYRVA